MIIYPVFFLLPGMTMLLVAAMTAHDTLFVPAIMLVMFASGIDGRLRLLLIGVVGILIVRAILNDISLSIVGLHLVGTFLLAIGLAVRCPRCMTHVTTRDQRWRGGPSSGWCFICGRDRRRVWPFQYMRYPEDWDGEYHDEGGGPPSPDSIVDWWRDNAFRRWKKHHRH